MRILIDTNIFIYREDTKIVPIALQRLLKSLNTQNQTVLVHPLSIQEIERDTNRERRTISLSKIGTYPLLQTPPDPTPDYEFHQVVGSVSSRNELVDNNLLYTVIRNAVDFLISEDQ